MTIFRSEAPNMLPQFSDVEALVQEELRWLKQPASQNPYRNPPKDELGWLMRRRTEAVEFVLLFETGDDQPFGATPDHWPPGILIVTNRAGTNRLRLFAEHIDPADQQRIADLPWQRHGEAA